MKESGLELTRVYRVASINKYKDTVTIKGIFSVEANEELDRVMNSKYNFITSGNTGIRTSSNEAIQSLYNLTLVLEDDTKKMTPTDRITFA